MLAAANGSAGWSASNELRIILYRRRICPG